MLSVVLATRFMTNTSPSASFEFIPIFWSSFCISTEDKFVVSIFISLFATTILFVSIGLLEILSSSFGKTLKIA